MHTYTVVNISWAEPEYAVAEGNNGSVCLSVAVEGEKLETTVNLTVSSQNSSATGIYMFVNCTWSNVEVVYLRLSVAHQQKQSLSFSCM